MPIADLAAAKAKLLERLLIEDQSVLRLTDSELEDSIREALDLFNVVAPLKKVYEQAGDGIAKRVVLGTAITGWVASVSQVLSVHFVVSPNTDDEIVRTLLKDNWVQDIDTADADILKWASPVPSGETLRIVWGTSNTIKNLDNATGTTIPERYTESYYLYALSTASMSVAQKAARLKQASFGADQTSFQEVYERWTDIARKKKRQAEERIGSIRGSVTGVGTSVNWNTKTKFGYGSRVSH